MRQRGVAPVQVRTERSPSLSLRTAYLAEVEPSVYELTSSAAAATHVWTDQGGGVISPTPIAGANPVPMIEMGSAEEPVYLLFGV